MLLPEMFSTGFSLNIHTTADTGGVVLDYLRGLARDHGVWVQGGRTVLQPGLSTARNEAAVLSPDGQVARIYHKIHPFSFGREPERFTGGTDVVIYDWVAPRPDQPAIERGERIEAGMADRIRVCPAICYDLRFPELFRRGLAVGAECFALGACWPRARQEHWRVLLVARAIENQAVVLGVNRTGRDPTLEYAGGSIAVGPRGEILGELGDQEGVLSVRVEPTSVREWRATFPAWKDRRLGLDPRSAP